VLSSCDAQCGVGVKCRDKRFWLFAFDLSLEGKKENLVLSAQISSLV
jgi:hypothetical protein